VRSASRSSAVSGGAIFATGVWSARLAGGAETRVVTGELIAIFLIPVQLLSLAPRQSLFRLHCAIRERSAGE
jgi:hypothetical protein